MKKETVLLLCDVKRVSKVDVRRMVKMLVKEGYRVVALDTYGLDRPIEVYLMNEMRELELTKLEVLMKKINAFVLGSLENPDGVPQARGESA